MIFRPRDVSSCLLHFVLLFLPLFFLLIFVKTICSHGMYRVTMRIDRGTHEARNAFTRTRIPPWEIYFFSFSRKTRTIFPTLRKTIKTRESPTSCLVKTAFTKDDTQMRASLAVDNNLLLLLLLSLRVYICIYIYLLYIKKWWNPCNYLSFNNEDVLPLVSGWMYIPFLISSLWALRSPLSLSATSMRFIHF